MVPAARHDRTLVYYFFFNFVFLTPSPTSSVFWTDIYIFSKQNKGVPLALDLREEEKDYTFLVCFLFSRPWSGLIWNGSTVLVWLAYTSGSTDCDYVVQPVSGVWIGWMGFGSMFYVVIGL